MAEIDWKARHDEVLAAVASVHERGQGDGKFVILGMLRAVVSDPAAVVAERDARVKAEALREVAEELVAVDADRHRAVAGYIHARAEAYREGQA